MQRAMIATAGAALAALAMAAGASAQQRVEVGVLTCTAKSSNRASSSARPATCAAASTGRARTRSTRGTISKFGIDIGATQQAEIAWAVLAPTANLAGRSLVGGYGGVSAEATVGVGVDANRSSAAPTSRSCCSP